MKKTGVLNHRLSGVIAAMGHTDSLVVADAGLPVPQEVERIDLAVSEGIPSVVDVLNAIASELKVEMLIVATELLETSPGLADAMRAVFPGVSMESVTHEEFKRRTRSARAIVRTGECTPYANVILVSGVIF
jgi:D-ribose pyranase